MNQSNYDDLIKELRTEYLQSFEEKFSLLRKLLADKDWYSIELEYHKLKGTGTTYGAPEVTKVCQILEHHCKDQSEISSETLEISVELLTKIRGKYLNDEEFDLESSDLFQKIQSL